MKKILLNALFIFCELCIVIPISIGTAFSQITCDQSGNVVLYSNYDGGILNINVDVNIPNLKIGVVSYEMVTINLTGPFVNNITEVQFAGYTTTTHHHCNNSPAITSIVGAPPGTDTLVFMPTSPLSNNNGYYIIICNYSCDTVSNQGGCNTPDQIAAYFQQEFGGLLRYHYTQYGCWNGTYNISDGGNCCISTVTSPPVALFSSSNHLCPGTCTDFTNLSSNASSFQWTFAGANPSTSTDVNPAGICYNAPGTYNVSLIATGAGGSDTVTLNNYITVYPYPPPQGIQQVGDTLFANQGSGTYQWYLNGILIPGATDYYYVATQSGDYNIICIDENGCEVESVADGVMVGLSDMRSNLNRINLYPNPVVGYLRIENLKKGIAADIAIYNFLGEKVYAAINSHEQVVDCRLLSPGIYWIEIYSGEGIYRSKFIKQ